MLALENRFDNRELVFPASSQHISAQFAPHFGLRQQPFISNLDRRYFFSHESAVEVINTLQYAIKSGEGITKITGISGIGKTFLTANLLSTMHDSFFVIKILNPAGSPQSLLKAILDEMCSDYRDDANDQQLTKLVLAALCAFYAKFNTPVVLSIDNAERLPIETLATLSTLNNLETQHRKLMQTILIGSNELDKKLKHPSLTSLRRRISFSAELKPLNREETINYIKDRTRISGNFNSELFSAKALKAIYKMSRGVPLLINIISHKGMMLAYGEGAHQVDRAHIMYAAKDTQQVSEYKRWKAPIAVYLPFVLALIASMVLIAIRYIST